jgi:hypothetical protein
MITAKRKARFAKTAPEQPSLLLRVNYHFSVLLARLFETPFWYFEKRRGRLADELERMRW